MNVRRNIILVGPMGSGKSAVGKQLARALRLPFFDSDAEIERRSGVDIPLIFEKEGEAGFRQRERGGAILLEENRRALREGGTVVYLETSVMQQAQRVRRGERRPLLSGVGDMSARLGALMLQRAPLYAEVAAITVQTDGQRVQQVVERILGQLP
jgi:shikimate kinase